MAPKALNSKQNQGRSYLKGTEAMPVPVMNVVPVPVRQNFAKNYIKKVKKSKFSK